MLFIFSTPVLIRHLWQLKTVVFLHWCLIRTVLLGLVEMKKFKSNSQLIHFHQKVWRHDTQLNGMQPNNLSIKGLFVTLSIDDTLSIFYAQLITWQM
jgi:hypothetical protein